MTLPDAPGLSVFNCAPSLLRRWARRRRDGAVEAPVTHRIPAAIMGSGLGKNTVWRGDYDIQLFDVETRRRLHLDSLRFGDMVAIDGADTRFGPSNRQGWVTLGVIVHGDSTVSGHGPGVTPLLTGPAELLRTRHDPRANLAEILGIRTASPSRRKLTLIERDSVQRVGYQRQAQLVRVDPRRSSS